MSKKKKMEAKGLSSFNCHEKQFKPQQMFTTNPTFPFFHLKRNKQCEVLKQNENINKFSQPSEKASDSNEVTYLWIHIQNRTNYKGVGDEGGGLMKYHHKSQLVLFASSSVISRDITSCTKSQNLCTHRVFKAPHSKYMRTFQCFIDPLFSSQITYQQHQPN
ncbi:CLUMA_CG003176, isoform A [Clunio marinus]|uniref:CLUMA_CG003176, isoform A n=1 Tax=Clunio marinus TaxID=568069 RepID=A0A1J1HN95_9DIPT|nr:CLUMA_CG003176, isoform A [Clunio marinus]